VLLVPAYLRAQRALGTEPAIGAPSPVADVEPVLVEGPAEGSMVVEAVVPQPRASADGGAPAEAAPAEAAPDPASIDRRTPEPAAR
jgi:hypothetical protein